MAYTHFNKVSGVTGLGVGAKGSEVVVADSSGNLTHGGTALTATAAELNIMDGVTSTALEINSVDKSAKSVFFDDFNMYQASFTEADSPYVLNSGSDGASVDAAISAAAGGTVALACGAGNGTDGVDLSNMIIAYPYTASAGNLTFEARVKVSAITNAQFFVGFTDVTTLELPVTIADTTVTTVMSDGVGFAYDAAATTDQWYCCGVKSNTDATGQAISGVAPKTSYQLLKIIIDTDGAGATFYIDGTLVGTLTANAVTAATAIYAGVHCSGDGTASKTLTCDYISVSHDRV